MFFIVYAFKGQVHVFAGRVKIVSHSSCRTSATLKYFCPLDNSSNKVSESMPCSKNHTFVNYGMGYVAYSVGPPTAFHCPADDSQLRCFQG